MLRRPPRGLLMALAGCLAVLLVLATLRAVTSWRDANRSDLARAMSLAPATTQRLSWTDWRAVRCEIGAVLTSDSSVYLKQAVAAATGEADRLTSVSDLVGDETAPLTAAVFTGAYACEKLAMASADDTDRAQAEELIRSAGDVHPLTGFAMASHPDGHISVTMSFESDAIAVTNADTRATLASGPAPGQGGDFAERFSVDSASADGRLVHLRLDPVEGQYVLSDLTSGPLLLATC